MRKRRYLLVIVCKLYANIKKATYSGFYYTAEKVAMILLDGNNNPGFSGSPVIFYDYSDNKYKITAIIAGYYFQENKIIGDSANKLTYPENSGIIQCYAIEDAIEILKRFFPFLKISNYFWIWKCILYIVKVY